jgi:hypothetical protein
MRWIRGTPPTPPPRPVQRHPRAVAARPAPSRSRAARAALAWLGVAGLAACTIDLQPFVPPGALVVADPAIEWVARIAWSDDGDELAFLGTPVHGPMGVFRVSFVDDTLLGTLVGGFDSASELRYLPGGRDLVVVGRPAVVPPVACGDDGVVVVHGLAPAAIVGCPFVMPEGLIGRAGNAAVDPDQFVAAHPAGTALAVPSASGAQRVDLATFATDDLGPGFPLAFDPDGDHLLLVEFDPAAWAQQRWWRLDLAGGARTQLPVAENRFARGYHVLGARWLAEGLLLLVERDLADGSEWLLWNLDTGAERVLGPARTDPGAFPLGREPRWSASGRLLAFSEYVCLRESLIIGCAVERWSIVVVDVATGERQVAYRGPDFVYAPAIAPGDDRVAFAVGSSIYVKTLR